MKKVFLSFLIFFTSFLSFAQFQSYSQLDSRFLAINFENSCDLFSSEIDKKPYSMSSDVAFISRYFDCQGGIKFQNDRFEGLLNFFGGYTTDSGLTYGLVGTVNFINYYNLANEFDYNGLLYIGYQTSRENFWKFCFSLGFGGLSTRIQYKKRGEIKWTDFETTLGYLIDISIYKKFCNRHTCWAGINSFSNYNYTYGLAPCITTGYNFDVSRNFTLKTRLDLNYVSFLTTNGRLKNVQISVGIQYRIGFNKTESGK